MVRMNNGAAILPKLSLKSENNLRNLSFNPKKYREIGMVTRKHFQDKEISNEISQIISNSIKN